LTSVSTPAEPKPRAANRPPAPRQGGSPGLTAAGVLVVLFAASLVGMLLDVFTGGGLGWIFGVFFIAASGYVASQVRRADLAWAVIGPPVVFAVLVVGRSLVTDTGGLLTKIVDGLNGLLDYGPMLWIGTGLAAVLVAVRVWRYRRPS
jgi:hypothetical protein